MNYCRIISTNFISTMAKPPSHITFYARPYVHYESVAPRSTCFKFGCVRYNPRHATTTAADQYSLNNFIQATFIKGNHYQNIITYLIDKLSITI